MKQSFDSSKQLIVVKARLLGPRGDTMMNLALDTGATESLIGWDSLTVVGYSTDDTDSYVEMLTGSGTKTSPILKIKQLECLGKRRRGMRVVAHSLPAGATVDGLLGLDFFRNSRLTIDFRKDTLKLD